MRLNSSNAAYPVAAHNPQLSLQQPVAVPHNTVSTDSFHRAGTDIKATPHFGAQYVKYAEYGMKAGKFYNENSKPIDRSVGFLVGFAAQMLSPNKYGPRVKSLAEKELSRSSGGKRRFTNRRSTR